MTERDTYVLRATLQAQLIAALPQHFAGRSGLRDDVLDEVMRVVEPALTKALTMGSLVAQDYVVRTFRNPHKQFPAEPGVLFEAQLGKPGKGYEGPHVFLSSSAGGQMAAAAKMLKFYQRIDEHRWADDWDSSDLVELRHLNEQSVHILWEPATGPAI